MKTEPETEQDDDPVTAWIKSEIARLGLANSPSGGGPKTLEQCIAVEELVVAAKYRQPLKIEQLVAAGIVSLSRDVLH